jgi:ABC-type transport system involved in multi-copper enzyme maturation permease subunit
MSIRRLALVCGLELGHNVRRPLYWILILIVVLMSWGLSTGSVQIRSGDSSVGGTKAWITSEFAMAQIETVLVFVAYSFFLAVAAGMTIIQDDEWRVGELLHTTPLRPGEYIWGKFLAVLLSFLVVLFIHVGSAAFFNHLVPSATALEFRGPFDPINYLRPALMFAVPAIVFLAGTSFFVGAWSRKPIVVFVLPVATLLGCLFFLWDWSPTWLDPRIDQILMFVDPAGLRWLVNTWFKVDRGVDFYNHSPIVADGPFLLSRLAFAFIGIGAVALCRGHFAATLRGKRTGSRSWLPKLAVQTEPEVEGKPLTTLRMTARAPGMLRGILEVARVEFRELRSSPGLYLFTPIILLQVAGTGTLALGAFGTPLLMTSGTLAVATLNSITLLLCLLLLFYTVESLERERRTRMTGLHHATPVGTASILFGKAVANSLVGVVILLAAWIACAIMLLVQGTVSVQVWPFALVWALLAVPTFLAWTSFVTFVLAFTGNRYTTYGVALGALALTGYLQFTKHMNWAFNWDLWSVLSWSDMSVFEVDQKALVLNRLMMLSLTVFFTALAVRFFPRPEFDPVRIIHRLRPAALFGSALRLLPYAVVPFGLSLTLYLNVYRGFEGDVLKKAAKDYWRKNLATWKDAPMPVITAADIDCDLEPAKNWFRVHGSYTLKNDRDKPLAQVPLTGGLNWENVSWTLNGADYEPSARSHLYVFTPPKPLAPGDMLQIGFTYEGILPKGISKNGSQVGEFVLTGGVVLTSFSAKWVPVVGFLEDRGVNDENRYESREYPEGWYEGITDAAFGSGSPFTTHIRVTGPADYTYNSVGTCEQNEVKDGRRTTVWKSDQPVHFFNLVAGRWAVRRGEGTAVFYDPRHSYNIDEMVEGLDAARRYYSEWFYPYPWRELKLSEFANLATYAQGFPTNITFSEGIGFLTKSDPRTNTAFIVTAHEAAHQWWGNMILPGNGPGGNIISEGMAHFSTILLCEQVKGQRGRMEFCKRIEESYNESRQQDSERPLSKVDGTRAGDTTVTYDRGGWVFWMLLRHMGRERALAGLHHFIDQYRLNPDHPVIEDLVASMKPFAPDPSAFDDFVKQWIFGVVVPEYRLSDARLVQSESSGQEQWEATVRLENVGTGKMPIEVAAVKGERFGEDGAASADYRDFRTHVVLGAGESQVVTLRSPFKPDRLVVDPDVLVLQLKRKFAVARF